MPVWIPRRPAQGVLVVIVVLGLINALGFWHLSIDDAYISLRYARNLLDGAGLVYNPGETVEGFSNPPWVLAMAAGLAVGLPSLTGAKLLGLAFHGAAMVGAWGLAVAVVRPTDRSGRVAAAVGVAFLAVSLPATWWSMQGLETTSYGALLVLACLRLVVELRDEDAWPWSAVLAAVAALSRPEAPIAVLGIVLARAMWDLRRGRLKAFGRWAALFFTPTVGYLVFRLAYFGYVFPNTFYQKGAVGGPRLLVDYLWPWVSLEWPFLVVGAIGLVSVAVARWRVAWPALAVVGGQLVFLAYIGRDWMPNQRFLAPVLPMLAFGAAAAGALAAGRLSGRARWLPVGALALGVVAQGVLSGPLERRGLKDGELVNRARTADMWFPRSLEQRWQGLDIVPVWLMQRAAPGASVVFADIGMLGWTTDYEVVDIAGLTSAEWSGATGLPDFEAKAAALGERAPDWIVLKQVPPARFRAIASSPWLASGYTLEQGPRDTLVARRVGVPQITDAEILANLGRAVAAEPRNARLAWIRAVWLQATGDAAGVAAACADLRRDFPAALERHAACAALPQRRSRRPSTAAVDLGPRLRAVVPSASAQVRVPPASTTAKAASAPSPDGGSTVGGKVEAGRARSGAGGGDRPSFTGDGPGPGPGWLVYMNPPDPERVKRVNHSLRVTAGLAGDPQARVCSRPSAVADRMRVVGRWRLAGVTPLDEGEHQGAKVFLVPLDASGRRILRGPVNELLGVIQSGVGDTGWARIDEEVDVPDGAENVRLCVEVTNGEGVAWFKDLSLLPVHG